MIKVNVFGDSQEVYQSTMSINPIKNPKGIYIIIYHVAKVEKSQNEQSLLPTGHI